jgi:hypothetical protein
MIDLSLSWRPTSVAFQLIDSFATFLALTQLRHLVRCCVLSSQRNASLSSSAFPFDIQLHSYVVKTKDKNRTQGRLRCLVCDLRVVADPGVTCSCRRFVFGTSRVFHFVIRLRTMAQYWHQFSETPAHGGSALLPAAVSSVSYPTSFSYEEPSHFPPDISGSTCPIELTQFADLLNWLFRCESSGLERTGYIVPPTQTLTNEKQIQIFHAFNLTSSPQDNEMREFFRALWDVLSYEAKQQERLHAMVNDFVTTYIDELKKSSDETKMLNAQTMGLTTFTLPPEEPMSPRSLTATPKSFRGRKRNLPPNATSILKKWLFEHSDNPYPAEDEKLQLVSQTGLSLKQINNWFINARRRILRPGNKNEGPDNSVDNKTKSPDDEEYREG